MLINARLYESELRQCFHEIEYDLRYQFINGCWGCTDFSLPDNNYDSFWFASVNEYNEVVGFVTAEFNRVAGRVSGLAAANFFLGSSDMTFIKDLYQFIDDLFMKYNFNSIEWHCYADNPACRGYQKLVKRFGGSVIGPRHQAAVLMDGKLHDSYCFEILKENYLKNRRI